MTNVIKAYLFIPSGFRNFIDHAFDGWRFVFFLYFVFSLILAYVTAPSLQVGAYIMLQPLFILLVFSLLTVASAFGMGAHEPLIKAMRLVALCLPPLGLTLFFIAEKSPLAYFGLYPMILYIVGSAFLGPRGKIINSAMGIAVLAISGVIVFLEATTADKWFGRELVTRDYRISLTEIPIFTENESRTLKYIVLSTPDLGHIPQVAEICVSLSLDSAAVGEALISLDRKGRIVLGADGEIRYAFPWAAYDNGYLVAIEKSESHGPYKPVYAASALHALSTAHIFRDCTIEVYGRLKDTGERISVEISDGKIESTNFPDALIYKSDTFSENNFYSSPTGAKISYPGRFDATRLLDLDRAIVVAAEMLQKRTPGLL